MEGGTNVYLWRLDDSRAIQVSIDNDGRQPSHGSSHSPSVSGNGQLVAFRLDRPARDGRH